MVYIHTFNQAAFRQQQQQQLRDASQVYLSQPGPEHVERVPEDIRRHQAGPGVVGQSEHPVVRPVPRQGLFDA